MLKQASQVDHAEKENLEVVVKHGLHALSYPCVSTNYSFISTENTKKA